MSDYFAPTELGCIWNSVLQRCRAYGAFLENSISVKMKLEANPQTAAARLKKVSRLRPTLAIVLGSGFHHVLTG